MQTYLFQSERLGFRHWQAEDLTPFFQMNSDSQVMKYFPATLSLDETQSLLNRIKTSFEKYGYGLYAVDQLSDQSFIGFIGFIHQTFEEDFTPCVEIGWRLKKEVWNRGYATEGAKRCLEFGKKPLNFKEVYSLTSIHNKASERVMQKIGMKKIKEFDHPKIDLNHLLCKHILYKISL